MGLSLLTPRDGVESRVSDVSKASGLVNHGAPDDGAPDEGKVEEVGCRDSA